MGETCGTGCRRLAAAVYSPTLRVSQSSTDTALEPGGLPYNATFSTLVCGPGRRSLALFSLNVEPLLPPVHKGKCQRMAEIGLAAASKLSRVGGMYQGAPRGSPADLQLPTFSRTFSGPLRRMGRRVFLRLFCLTTFYLLILCIEVGGFLDHWENSI